MTLRRAAIGAWVLVVAVVVDACGSGKAPSTLAGAGSESKRVAGIWWLAFGVGAAVYLIVGGLIVFGAFRNGGGELDDRRIMRERVVIAIGGVAIPFVILLCFAAVTVNAAANLRKTAPANSVHVVVTGKRWWWAVNYPALDITTANEIHLPVGQPVDIELLSDNVIHSFWVPQLAGKEDMIPGQPNHISFTIRRAGIYRGECAEYCGLEHARMGFYVIAQAPADFTKWVALRKQLSSQPTSDETAAGERVFMREACAGCHMISNTPATGTIGPDLTDMGGRRSIAAGELPNTPENLARWITDPQGIKPGNLMPPIDLSHDDVNAIAAYLESLK